MKGYQALFPGETTIVSSDVLNAPTWASQVILKLQSRRQLPDFESVIVMILALVGNRNSAIWVCCEWTNP